MRLEPKELITKELSVKLKKELKEKFSGRNVTFTEGDGLLGTVYRADGVAYDAYDVHGGSWVLLFTWEDLKELEDEDEREYEAKQISAWCRESGYSD